MKRGMIGGYLKGLLKGSLALLILLTWGLEHKQTGWSLTLTPLSYWAIGSWLVGYPGLRHRYAGLFGKDDESFVSYKKRALTLHHQDIASGHRGRRWTTNGVAVNPWAYTQSNMQSTDEILNPIYLWCEHLWLSLLLIVAGPLLIIGLLSLRVVRAWRRRQ